MLKTFEAGLNKVETILVCAGLLVLIFTVFAAAVLRFFGVDMSVSTDLASWYLPGSALSEPIWLCARISIWAWTC